jgi:colanic acid/amylovoran biosynthesis glycosyltransferase
MKSIFYFVDEIESTFVLNDILVIAGRYDRIYLFSIDPLENKVKLPANVVVFEAFINWKNFSPLRVLTGNVFSILGIYLNECLSTKKIINFKAAISILASNIFKASEVRRHIDEHGLSETIRTAPFYSFWFYDCIYLAWMKKKGMIGRAIARAHSGDLYEDHISIKDRVLLRNFQVRYLSMILPVSRIGTQYLQNKYKSAQKKIRTIYLGSEDPVMTNPFSTDSFVIVSCASLRHHKRIHRIAEALTHVNIPITWHHFGSENLDTDDPKIGEYVKWKDLLKAKQNVTYISHGYTDNQDLFEFYRTIPVNFFVSLSAAEGIPVSIMEATSFGIPVLSTDVGGCREIVTEQTGKLIPLETSVESIAGMLTALSSSDMNTKQFRQGVRKFWEQNFDRQHNYIELFKALDNQDN